MHKLAALLAAMLAMLAGCSTLPDDTAETARWRAHAQNVTIARDDWGIAHVRGRTDADAVFGMIYAQAEDDFNRIETNYLTHLGRLAEAEGAEAIWSDLRMRLFLDHDDLKARYRSSPDWLRRLAEAWADGLNFYLAEHPGTRPRVLTRFEPWMAMSFTEGSIGADFERVPLAPLEAFYSGRGRALAAAPSARDDEPRGSNGIAIAPALTENGRALLLINPHTSFFFRSELQVTSEEGLNAYGAATWGQFFIYQGFNERLGWMHTTSGLDVVDEFAETIVDRGGRLFYRHGGEERPVETRTVSIAYRRADGTQAERSFQTYRTHHGPVTREEGGRWVATALMHRPVEALSQAWLRTKARDFASFQSALEHRANSSNNTLYADADGNIAYLHPQFIPRRDDRFDYTQPVDGSDPAADWGELHALAEAPRAVNPPNGWVFNTNNWPYSAAGPNSPRASDFERYMDTFGENPRGQHALMLLEGRSGWTIDRLRDAAFDSYLPAFAEIIPPLVRAWDRLPAADPFKARLRDDIALLRSWDYRWGVDSAATSLAIFWGDALWSGADEMFRRARRIVDFINERTTDQQKLRALASASDRLQREFGSRRVPWGEINRFQRLTGDIVQNFRDGAPSTPVGFTSGLWGSLASFGAQRYPGTRRWYGTSGNSFVAIVEFGDRVRARAVTAGGESGHPRSPHFNDQADRYATGNLRGVYFYPDQLSGHTERTYRPGE